MNKFGSQDPEGKVSLMNDTGTFATVKSERCDLCKKVDIGLEYHHLGCPVLFSCRRCGPHHFQHEAASLLLKALLPSVFDGSLA